MYVAARIGCPEHGMDINPQNFFSVVELLRQKLARVSPGSLVGSYFLNWQNMKGFHYIPTPGNCFKSSFK